ncbi:transglycosylase domain-containing protein [Anaerobiospirillum sp. NML120448]|uniref:penicillin-binding protein 1A n=1 Tax=Anaerobiospirillum sp. NML120448 TaxID=2932816 RepID=UPI001FF2E857|nr:transglycosylase domain-containing protein [Anaerobiospirillum sp. NML120448]
MLFKAMKLAKLAFWAGIFCAAASGGVIASAYYSTLEELPDVDELKHVSFETPMKIYTNDGKLIGEFGEHKRIPVSIEDIPLRMQQAFLAIEDSRFYEHSGIDPIGILRAVVVAATSGGASQGASTITQQVARNFFLTRDKTLERKIKEVFIAWRIEQVLSKDEILELYLNKIALGHRSYGVVAAAQTYYGKTLEELSLAEIATIAGLPKAPSTLNPITSPQRAKDRRHLVLQRMLTLGYITPEEFDLADSAPSRAFFHSAPLEAYAPYVAEEARQAVIAKYGEDAYIKGLKVYTTVDSQYQQYAHDAIFENLTAYDVRHGYRGPLLNIFDSTRGLRGSAKLATEKNGAHANANNGVIMAKRAELAEQYEAQGIKYDYQTLVSEVDKLNLLAAQIAKVEQDFNNEKALDLIRKENKYQSIDPALVVSVDDENKQAIVLLPNGEQKALTWDGMSWARAFKTDRSQGNDPKYPSEFLQAGDLIFTYVKQVEPKKKAKNNEPQVTEVLTLTQIPDVESALISLDPKSGAVRAMAGGFDFEKSKFNRTTQLLRQTGSSFKPFIYSSAIAYGIALNSVIPDEPIKTWDVGSRTWWQPRNSPNRFDGLMTLREGLAKSKNSIAIRTIRHVGVENAVEHLRKFNILVPKFQQSEAMALGSVEVTPLQLATAYSAFANGGYKITPYLIEKIEMENGEVLYQAHPKIADHSLPDNIANAIDLRYAGNYKPDARDRTLARFVNNKNETNYPNLNLDSYDETNITIGDDMPKRPVKDHLENIALPSSAKLSMAALSDLDSLASPNSNYPHPPQILSHTHAYLISSLMHSNVYGGEGLNGRYWGTGAKAAALTGRDDLHAKTGTTNNVHDAWFSGYNGNLVVTTWVGFDNDRDLGYTRGRGSESGGVTALPIFSSFFKKAQEGVESAQIPRPRGLSWTTNREITEPAIPGMIVIDDGSSAQSIKNTGIDSSDVNSGDIF